MNTLILHRRKTMTTQVEKKIKSMTATRIIIDQCLVRIWMIHARARGRAQMHLTNSSMRKIETHKLMIALNVFILQRRYDRDSETILKSSIASTRIVVRICTNNCYWRPYDFFLYCYQGGEEGSLNRSHKLWVLIFTIKQDLDFDTT